MSYRLWRKNGPPPPAGEYSEWTSHQYDPGYWASGRIPPYLKRRPGRSNPYGYLLLAGAFTSMIGGGLWLTGDFKQRVLESLLLAALVLFQIAAGLRLIKTPRRRR